MIVDSEIAQLSVDSKRQRFLLAVVSGVMVGCSFPPSPFSSLAYVAFIPFFIVFVSVDTLWRLLRTSYVMLFVFHVITLYWTGGFTHLRDPWLAASGVALLLVHPLFYWPTIMLSWFVRKRLGVLVGLLSFSFFWVGFEYVHSLEEIAFPWLTLGNSQAYDLARVQILEYTSVYGLSWLILLFNLLGFLLITCVATGRWRITSLPSMSVLAALVIVYFGPVLYGTARMAHIDSLLHQERLRVAVIQPNIDPWEKWGEGYVDKFRAYEKQLDLLLTETKKLEDKNLDLIVWPETAIPYRILLPQNFDRWRILRDRLDSIGVPLFTGIPFTTYYDSLVAPKTANRIQNTSMYYEDFNSAVLIVPGQGVGDVYKKILLVPFGERIPYAETLHFLIEPFKWNVGIGMWAKGKDTVVFSLPVGDTIHRFSGMICYESVFPNFVRQFVRRGAEFLIIITNDSWWGNTSGAYQHAAYASLRAVETRRWIIRAANGGISGFVDPSGRIHSATSMYTQATIVGTIQPSDQLTFYVEHGDLFALLCLFCSGIFVILGVSRRKQ
jgi:apolipoprotein N-acyltransferase